MVFYSLSKDPFTKEIDTDQAFKCNDFVQASNRLDFLKNARGFGVITGEPGSGKTFVLNCFLSSLNPSLFKAVYIPISTLTVNDFYTALCDGLGIVPAHKKIQMFAQLQETIASYYTGKHIVVLCGQTQFVNQLSRQPLEAVRQRIVVNYTMKGLAKSECTDFIKHRLKLAGRIEPLFSEDALESLSAVSNGCLRTLNSLARMSLICGANRKAPVINSEIVYQAQAELAIMI
jgi:type II secretory pathway predicted ATPase ExeA